MAYHSPFDLYYWFVQTFAGSTTIFFGIALVVMAMIAGMFRMSSNVLAIMFGLFIVMFATYTQDLYLVVLILAAWFVGWSIVRYFK